jgi:hypothetical protein
MARQNRRKELPMQQLPLSRDGEGRLDQEVVEVPFYSIRNASCPEDLANGRKVLFGHMPAKAILGFGTEENVRDYLVGVRGQQRRVYKQVHRAIRETLETTPHEFSVLNGGVVIVARDYEVDEKKKVLRLLQPNIINGSQTQGVLRDYYESKKKRGEELPNIHITFELIVTEDDDLIAKTSIARNFQEDVMAISIVGRLGQLDELRNELKKVYPELELRTSETHISDEYVVTEKLIQVITALTPPQLWPKAGEEGNPNKTYTYSAKTRCLKDFQVVYEKAHDENDPEHKKYERLYRFYLDIAPQAYALYEKWKVHQGFIGTRRKAIERDSSGKITGVPDGMLFPIFAALSAFVEETDEGWKVVEPVSFTDKELIDTADKVYEDVAKSNPQTMGKSQTCYGYLYQLTSLHKRLSK